MKKIVQNTAMLLILVMLLSACQVDRATLQQSSPTSSELSSSSQTDFSSVDQPPQISTSEGIQTQDTNPSEQNDNPELGLISINIADEPPLATEESSITAPDFLTDEQQTLYRKAVRMYKLFRLESASVEDFPLVNGKTPNVATATRFDSEGITYLESVGRYKEWDIFLHVVESVFTPELFQALNVNVSDQKPIFLNSNGTLYYRDISYPTDDRLVSRDQFELIEKTDDQIHFQVIAQYANNQSDLYATGNNDESKNEVNSFTQSFDIIMVKTRAGWHFSKFEIPF